MKKLIAIALLAVPMAGALAQTSVGVSIGINQPGVFGRINIGDMPPPVLVQPQPVVIAPGPVAMHQSPIYLYVPPEHQQNWRAHCHRYNACGQPVYFVRESWVRERYEERRRFEREHERGREFRERDHDRGEGRGRGRDHDRGDRDDRRGEGRGR
jgi:hypothetical protein